VKLQCFQDIGLNDIPTDKALGAPGEMGDYIPVFLEAPLTQVTIVEEQEAVTVPESADGMAQSHWPHYRRNHHRIGVWSPAAEQLVS